MTRTPHRLNLLIGIMGLSIDVVVPHSANIRRKEQARMIKDFENGQCGQRRQAALKKERRPGTGAGTGAGGAGEAMPLVLVHLPCTSHYHARPIV